ncbi:MAG: diguanylate cyclase [Thermoanaerobaculia bacterium]
MFPKYLKEFPESLKNHLLKNLIENTSLGVFILNEKKEVVLWSRGAKKITGFSFSEVLGKKMEDFTIIEIYYKKKEINFEKFLEAYNEKEKTDSNLSYIRHKEKYRFPIEIQLLKVSDEKSGRIFFCGIFKIHDLVVYTKKLINSLKKRANQDFLTKLPNRRFLEFIINKKIQEFKRFSTNFGIILFDINNFKEINDNFGHSTGDNVLREFSKTIKLNLRECDIFGRWGGDEFIAIILMVKKSQLKKISDNFIKIIGKKLFNEKKGGFYIAVSAGFTLVQKEDDLGCLIDRADKNMYRKKLKIKVSRNAIHC